MKKIMKIIKFIVLGLATCIVLFVLFFLLPALYSIHKMDKWESYWWMDSCFFSLSCHIADAQQYINTENCKLWYDCFRDGYNNSIDYWKEDYFNFSSVLAGYFSSFSERRFFTYDSIIASKTALEYDDVVTTKFNGKQFSVDRLSQSMGFWGCPVRCPEVKNERKASLEDVEIELKTAF